MIAQKSRKRDSTLFWHRFYLGRSPCCSTDEHSDPVKKFVDLLLHRALTPFGIFYFKDHQSGFSKQKQSINESRNLIFGKSDCLSFNCNVDLSYHPRKDAYGHRYDFRSALNALQLVVSVQNLYDFFCCYPDCCFNYRT